ncbi:hypothetical protein AeMF1_016671 [Aphanomyces euteiches]|nr:hypothetical protein AeMF1_016671 [Aphanomyces euteiches]KAH9185703.1 hypothetical protein AeNC1_012321 [Aphanomyces euteiches]
MKSDDATSRPPMPWPNVLISNPTAVVHVLTKRLTPPTNVQVYCLLFNSQGQLVEHMDHHTTSKDGAIVQVARNQYGHDQKFVVTLAKVNPGIDVIGFVVSHSDDMIFDPTKALEACSVQCVLHLHNVDEILTHVHGDILCDADFPTSPGRDKAFLFRNAVMVCKLYRDGRQRSHWNFNPTVEGMKCASHCIVGLTRCAQLHLVDIVPDIDIPNVTSLHSIYGICSALSSVEFLAFENMFPVHGFDKQSFATCLCEGMVHSRPELRSEKRIVALLSLLFEMFDQIDINGDGHVDWEEFTSFCVALGMISTKQSKLGSKSVEFAYKPHACHGTKTFPYHMTKLKCFEHLRKIAVLESMSPVISIFDFDGHFLHDMTNIAKSSVMKEGMYVLDMDHVPSKNCYVVAASDRSITLWSILNAVKGQYVQSGKIINHDMAMIVKWCPVLKLCFASSVKHATLWNLDKCKVEHKLPFHSDFVTDIVELPAATRMFATCSFDHKVAVWEVDRMKVVFEWTKHTQAVTHMDCNGNVLVSCGFEHHAHVWSIATRKHLVMLTGHHDALVDVKLTRQHAAHLFCVTGDASGHCKVWDISRCIVDASKDAAVVLHTYTLGGGGVDTTSSLLSSFAVVPDHKRKTPLPEIWTGNLHVVRLVPDMIASLDSPLQYVLYNQVSHSFTASIAGRITVWSGKSGAIIQEPIVLSNNVDVCGLCFDLPRQRKLFDGSIRMYNPITGVLMDTAKLHGGEILGMIYCERTHCLISNATDDSLSICNDVPGEGRLDPLRTIANVNKNPMTSCAYSSELGFIATGDASGRIRVHDFQRLSFLFSCEHGGNCEVTALAFHKQTCVLFAGYSTGDVHVWHILHGVQSSKSQCIMRLTTTATVSSFVTETPTTTTTGSAINSLCVTEDTDFSFASIVAGDDNGRIHCWPLRLLRQHARGILKLCFEPLPDTMIAYTRGGYNPNLRLSRRQSVSSSPPQKATFAMGNSSQRVTQVVCVAETLTWKAHDAKVLQVQPLQFPGFFYSYDDFGVKLWDAQGDCLGTLQRKYDQDNQTPLEWQYRTSVLFKDNSAEMHALATQILTRVANKEEVVLSEPNDDDNAAAADEVPRAEEQDVTGYLGETKKASPRTFHRTTSLANLKTTTTRTAKTLDDTIGWSHSMENVQVKAEHDTAFSRQSLQDGLKDGVFTQEESLWLERMSLDDHQRRNYETILFPPLLLSPVELKKRYAKQFVKMGHEPIETLPMLRTCDHFAHEMAVKKASKQPRAVQAIEEPSSFLKQHLETTRAAAAAMSPGKTRKRRIPMDGHGFVHTTIVPLPALAAPPHHDLMTRSTSTPVFLPTREHERMEKSRDVQQQVRPDVVRDNIVRKMTLCATLRHDVEAPKTLARSGTMSTADKTRRIDPVEWAKVGKNPFGPHYSVRQVLEFGETLLRFDKDLSGDIDQDEWMKIMTAFMTKTQAVDVAVAKDLFASVDLNQDGLISLHELVRVVFCHATKTQWSLMEDFIRRSSHGAHVEQEIKSQSM